MAKTKHTRGLLGKSERRAARAAAALTRDAQRAAQAHGSATQLGRHRAAQRQAAAQLQAELEQTAELDAFADQATRRASIADHVAFQMGDLDYARC
jgi:hypothetical protein